MGHNSDSFGFSRSLPKLVARYLMRGVRARNPFAEINVMYRCTKYKKSFWTSRPMGLIGYNADIARPRFIILIVFVAGGLLALGVALLLTHLRASIGYSVSARYAQMPADDKALEDWIKTQPDVVPRTVYIGRKGDELYVLFIRLEKVFGRPPFPDLSGACVRLGYGPPSDWKDVEGGISF